MYNIYLKMLKNMQRVDEIHDLCGLRLIVLDDKDCYATLQIVHHCGQIFLGRFYVIHCVWDAAEAYLAPSIVLSSHTPYGVYVFL